MPSKLCPHSLNPVPELRQFVEAGCPLVKLVNDFGPAAEFKASFPNLVVVGRITEAAEFDPTTLYRAGKSFEQAARELVDRQKEKYRLNPAIQIWEGPNEPAFGDGRDPANLKMMHWYGDFEAQRLRLLADMGLRGVVGNFATGNPDLPQGDPMAMWREFLPAIRAAREHDGFLGVHEYSSPWMWYFYGKFQLGNCPDFDGPEDQGDTGFLTFRYRKYYRDLLIPEGLGAVPLVITEFGLDRAGIGCPGSDMPAGAWKELTEWWRNRWDGRADPIDYWRGAERDPEHYYAEQLIWADRELRKDPYVLGACIFTFGSAGNATWERFNISGTRVAGRLLDYIATARNQPDETPDVVTRPPCVNNARYVADITIPDNSEVEAGKTFVKTWRIRNTGTCEWDPGYTLRFMDGEKMSGPDSVPLTGRSPPAGETDVSVELTAPASPGPATGRWRLHDPNGSPFGSSAFPFTVVIQVVESERLPCTDNARFVADVTIPDGSGRKAGETFTKTWRVENTGDCEWAPGYQLVFAGGARMDGPERVAFGRRVLPGEQLDLSVQLRAPVQSGRYEGRWRLQDAAGANFGLRGFPLTVIINVTGQTVATAPTLVGLHGRADGPLKAADLEAIRESKVEAVKLVSTARPEDVDAVRAIRGDMLLLVRLFVAFLDSQGQRTISAAQFANDTREDLRKFYARGVRYFEIHNEPNLIQEGYGKNWTGATFADWWFGVRDALKVDFPEALWGWPGVSPGPVLPGVRGEAERDFVLGSRRALLAADWIGVHCYWQNRAEMISPEAGNGWKWYREKFPGKSVMVTEFSNPHPAVAKVEKASQYVDWLAQLDGPMAVFSYVSSASVGYEHETWVEIDQRLSVIPGVVGRR